MIRPLQLDAVPRALDLSPTPTEVIARWPAGIPAAWLVGPSDAGASRWTILGVPSGPVERADPWRVLATPARRGGGAPPAALPFDGGWIGWLSYELGERIEPAAARPQRPAAPDRDWPVCHMVRCDAALVHDARSDRWSAAGDVERCREVADAIVRSAAPGDTFRVGRLRSATGREQFERDARRVIDLIHAGDAFQVNLSHRLCGAFAGSPRAMFTRLARATSPLLGAYIESTGDDGALLGAVCSASPEWFLRVDGGDGHVVTRPMKGTRPMREGPDGLRASEKDRAELAMIVDLMRNDLGRVCAFGSVRVDEPRTIEPHHGARTGVWQGVATVSGLLRPGVTHAELLRATFPPGSVTGAPKVRAMQIIRRLEPVTRGPYCGAIGFVSDCGSSAWSVAIRTAALTFGPGATPSRATGTVDYGVGAGIVADSDPRAEWRETLAKAAAFRHAMGQDTER